MPDYRLRSDTGSSAPYDLQTITTTDLFSPLLGLDTSVGKSLTLSAAYVLRKSHSILTESLRLLSQTDQRCDVSLRYQLKLPPLIRSSLPLLSSTSTNLESSLGYSLTHTSLEETDLRRSTQNRLRGLDTHSLRLTLDYHCSRSLSIRGFWREDIRTPLVTGRQYPYRKSSYGAMLLLTLHP